MRHPGGSIKAHAGDAHGASQKGGDVELSAGTGSHPSSGSGGSIWISGGHAAGTFKRDGMNDGGDVQIFSGSSAKGLSGSVLIQSGFSEGASTGKIGETTLNFFALRLKNEFSLIINFDAKFSACHNECWRQRRIRIHCITNWYIVGGIIW